MVETKKKKKTFGDVFEEITGIPLKEEEAEIEDTEEETEKTDEEDEQG